MIRLYGLLILLFLASCGSEDSTDNSSMSDDGERENDLPAPAGLASAGGEVQKEETPPRFAVDVLDERGEGIFGFPPEIDTLFGGMSWSEGPLWLPKQQMIICSDVPNNHILSWREGEGKKVWLANSGIDGSTDSPEPGSNGLILDSDGRLVACRHGSRQVARLLSPLDDPIAEWEVLADNFRGRKLNSPNDLVYDSTGQLYFTDPPYGLAGQDDDPTKEMDFNGVYRIGQSGDLELLTSDLRRPNGIALSPDGRTLYIANSDAEEAIIIAYELDIGGQLSAISWTLDLTHRTTELPGLPDGLEVAQNGQIFATGPGGVWVIDPDGTPLVRLSTGYPISNVELDAEEEYLYMTSDPYLVRAKLASRL
ncbi:MAG: SMP-30/gluconolactonase/LRE family protein [Bacteroidota bacterium]